MVYRVYVEKKQEYASEAAALLDELRMLPDGGEIEKVRIINRYDVENIDKDLFDIAVRQVFSEPQLDNVYFSLDFDGAYGFAYEFLPGQFDQRAASAAECIQLISMGELPVVRSAKVILIYGGTEKAALSAKAYLINPVESREASFDLPDTLILNYGEPDSVPVLDGFLSLSPEGLSEFIAKYALAMDEADIAFCQQYFKKVGREPTLTEIRMLDTYWSDHCRHTTFLTTIDSVRFENEQVEKTYAEYLKDKGELNRGDRPTTLMDIAVMGARYLKAKGLLKNLDESEEINACTVKVKVDVNGKPEDWLFFFKNETHNHPTEIEPFGGAATCIGGAIRDPLSGRGYVYQAMRITGCGDPTVPVSQTLKGKLPQRKIAATAAAGYSSYGNQIGLATGVVDEIYHDGYIAKHMELGAVVGAAPQKNVRRERPEAGDIVVLLGGKTGRDGCGGATGSSKSHSEKSLSQCGAEVQKGNPPEERKLQRLFRNKRATRLIKRCNDFGAGGVSVAIGELADGLKINLDAVPKKYDGLSGTELAISESQERMAVVLAPGDVDEFLRLAGQENLEATVVAEVTEEPRLTMFWRGDKIVDIEREFLNSNGAPKSAGAVVAAAESFEKTLPGSLEEGFKNLVGDLNVCSKRGLSERFDSTIGAASVLMPFGGRRQRTPAMAMAAKFPVLSGETKTASVFSFGYNPYITEKDPYRGAYLAVLESVCKNAAAGGDISCCYLTFQEYFERMTSAESWGKPLAALLGAYRAQKDLGLASIGGKDSMSGSFEHISVPPTLISFAASVSNSDLVLSPEFKRAGNELYLLVPSETDGLPDSAEFLENTKKLSELNRQGRVLSCSSLGYGGLAEAVFKASLGNALGAKLVPMELKEIFGYRYGAYLIEVERGTAAPGVKIGEVSEDYAITFGDKRLPVALLEEIYENRLESVYKCNKVDNGDDKPLSLNLGKKTAGASLAPAVKTAKPRVLIPVFPGTNCEYDTARAFERNGAEAEIFVINNLSSSGVSESAERFAKLIRQSQIIFLPGGFSGGDEPEGSGKFITAFFRNGLIKDAVHELLKVRKGLMGGICNGFQALIKLGLAPYGEITDCKPSDPTLTFNRIGRHQSKLVRVKVCSNSSPWLSEHEIGDVGLLPISHGEGRFVADEQFIKKLAENGQIATQYVDENGNPTMDIDYNPNGSVAAVEGITSPDGRVFGRMGHSERYGDNLYKNVPGQRDTAMFRGAVRYFE